MVKKNDMKNNLLLLLFAIAFFGTTFGQQPIRCYTMEMDAALRAKHPEMESLDQFEVWLQKKITERRKNLEAGRITQTVLTIPVIVHVIHNGDNVGSGENISQAQVNSQIDVLNEDFRKIMGTAGWNTNPVGADTEIEFCMAVVDPNGTVLAEPGIDRQNMGQTNWSTTAIDNTLKPATSWDPNQYFNMWVVRFSNGSLLGYAQFPNNSGLNGLNANNGAANTDGVVIGYNYFGRVGAVSPPFNKGRTATHEVGHCFGLRHIWGDGGCGTDDYCADTPDSDQANYNCPTVTHCGSVDMVQNYMDYTDDACMNIFTINQKERIQTVMTNSPRRLSLPNSTVCQLPNSPPTAAFTADITTGCPGTTINFTDNSTNGPTQWSWDFGDGGTSTSQNPSHTYAAVGSYTVSLTAYNAFGNNNSTQNNYITISNGALSVFWLETFENGTNGWTVNNPDGQTTWAIYTVAGNTPGTKAGGINLYNYNNAIGQRDGLISPVIDFTGKAQVTLDFEHAHRRYSVNEQDSLIIRVSTDGGSTWPFRVFGKSENGTGNFATNTITTADFIPATISDWCIGGVQSPCFTVDLSNWDNTPNMRLKFETYNDYGNNIYVDNITLSGTCTGGVVAIDPTLSAETIKVYPNPANDRLNISVPASMELQKIELFDNLGRIVHVGSGLSRNRNTQALDISSLPEGIYFVKVNTTTETKTIKIVKTH